MIGFPIFIVFVCVWYLPLFLKHRKKVKEPIKYYVVAALLGIVCFVISLFGQTLFGLMIMYIPMSYTMMKITGFFRILIGIAVVEELAKFFLGRLVLKKVPDLTEVGSMLILGMTGIGFGLVETVTQLSVFSAVIRGVLMTHLFFQIIMGKYWWRAQEARKSGNEAEYKKNIRVSLLVPILVHAVYDYLLLKGVGGIEEESDLGVVLVLGGFVVGLAYIIYGLIVARKTVKAEALTAPESEA